MKISQSSHPSSLQPFQLFLKISQYEVHTMNDSTAMNRAHTVKCDPLQQHNISILVSLDVAHWIGH